MEVVDEWWESMRCLVFHVCEHCLKLSGERTTGIGPTTILAITAEPL